MLGKLNIGAAPRLAAILVFAVLALTAAQARAEWTAAQRADWFARCDKGPFDDATKTSYLRLYCACVLSAFERYPYDPRTRTVRDDAVSDAASDRISRSCATQSCQRVGRQC